MLWISNFNDCSTSSDLNIKCLGQRNITILWRFDNSVSKTFVVNTRLIQEVFSLSQLCFRTIQSNHLVLCLRFLDGLKNFLRWYCINSAEFIFFIYDINFCKKSFKMTINQFYINYFWQNIFVIYSNTPFRVSIQTIKGGMFLLLTLNK